MRCWAEREEQTEQPEVNKVGNPVVLAWRKRRRLDLLLLLLEQEKGREGSNTKAFPVVTNDHLFREIIETPWRLGRRWFSRCWR